MFYRANKNKNSTLWFWVFQKKAFKEANKVKEIGTRRKKIYASIDFEMSPEESNQLTNSKSSSRNENLNWFFIKNAFRKPLQKLIIKMSS